MKIIVLGAGLVGGPIARDLARNGEFEVTAVDVDPENLDRLGTQAGISLLAMDVRHKEKLRQAIGQHDLVVNAVPGHLGFETLDHAIGCGKNIVDIAFFAEDMFQLDAKAREAGITVISDMGVAPGMSNVLLAQATQQLDVVHRGLIYVGGLPVVRTWPWEYKAVFSPADVIEEYLRPARLVENGREVVREALSEPELIDFEGVGTLEAFNSDGLRSLAKTIKADFLAEKTLRYPGYIDKIKVLRSAGFFDTKPIDMQGTPVSPLELTSKLLFSQWRLQPGEEDFTVMRVLAQGEAQGKPLSIQWDLLDRYDPLTDVHSMARTTGYAATAAVRALASGLYSRKGVSAPEFLGHDPIVFEFLLAKIAERGIQYRCTRR